VGCPVLVRGKIQGNQKPPAGGGFLAVRQKLLAHRLDALCAQGLANALTSDQNTDCLQIRVEFTIGRVEGMAARLAEHRFLTALFTLRHDDILVQKLRTRFAMLPQAGIRGKME
jgi:hypothetical protein